ncbi:ll-diaminopimelate aminotransferase [Nannochloropsis oceanica]
MMRQTLLLALALLATSSHAFLAPLPTATATRARSAGVMHISGVERNPNFDKLVGGYLFPEIGRRRTAFLEANPTAKIISLGIGDTTQPIPPHILSGLVQGAARLGTPEGYSGYGDEKGAGMLREKIAAKLYGNRITADEVFVSDGAKCDIGRLQMMFGQNVVTAVQDPSYPVYVDTAVIMGQTGGIDEESRQFDGIVYMPCTPSNDFFPDLTKLSKRPDVIYFCSPNNPTGVSATRAQLESLVAYARAQGSIIVFDAAYAPFIRDPALPKSIFEIEGALECAIEVNSFSKYAGFTGVRLGWTVVPKQLKFKDGSSVHSDFNRIMGTAFNGASNVVQPGGLAILDDEGMAEIQTLINYYLANAAKLRQTVEAMGYKAYGGDNGPYVYVDLGGKSSWDMFSEILEKAQIVTTPGAGFGPGGEGFLRLSAFASKENVEEACERLQKVMAKSQ